MFNIRIKVKGYLENLTENTKEIQNAENKTDPVKTESKISEEDEYINSFNGLKQYDMDKEQDINDLCKYIESEGEILDEVI